VSRRRDIDARLEALDDIAKIMRSMKNLSYMETRKLSRFLGSQRRVVDGIDRAARDFLSHHRVEIGVATGLETFFVLIGSERGFCGNFNEALLRKLEDEAAASNPDSTLLIVVGGKLAAATEGDPRLAASLPGASDAEEVPAVLNELVQTLDRLAVQRRATRVVVLSWDADARRVEAVPVLPPFPPTDAERPPAHPFPPRLNLRTDEFLEHLIAHYLFASLHELLYGSLMAENQQRTRHLEGALRRAETRVHELQLRHNALRQEEITEEIELILLNLPAPRDLAR
jgi:F-type H+-transporting ATPase subunit gamma